MDLKLKCLWSKCWTINCQPWTVRHTGTAPKHEDEVCSSDDDLTMFDSPSSDKEEDDESSDPDDYCHHIEKMSTNIQIFSIFITSLIITNKTI
jgi:hypothetical protein